MPSISKLKKILEVLEKHGEGNEFVLGGHDIIYLSSAPRDAKFARARRMDCVHLKKRAGSLVSQSSGLINR